MTTYTNTTSEPVTVAAPLLTIEPGADAELTEAQERSPQAQRAIRRGELVPVEQPA